MALCVVCMQVLKRMAEMRKCGSVEDTGRALCTTLIANQELYVQCMGPQELYVQCMGAHDIKVGECKFRIETGVKKCEEELQCKVRRGRGGGRGKWPSRGMCACVCGCARMYGLMAKATA